MLYWRMKNKILYEKSKELITKLKKEQENNTSVKSSDSLENFKGISSPSIPDETLKILFQKLEKFEKSEKYLSKEITLTWLANKLNTNTKYLSELIKIYRDKNFSNYINELRINYIVHKLYNEPIYREYKVSYLAEECGFASPQVFVIAFKKINEVTPSYFIKTLQTEKDC
ncbi:YesN/AraC family two-component response regulator [Chryseobacterium defluvii]|uniref:YesN/AraC family two-component response regulator n=1 Tax=Chryseobacterium defluvii TaxID=160396 RepID=A0A840K5I3_9FLAO|nr:AraC family transcriptional regulator [Chryseobacterium defluvii]MBB4804831.1 YesN/AraC family two-component response regulator [Chryseobacterium defluvii]